MRPPLVKSDEVAGRPPSGVSEVRIDEGVPTWFLRDAGPRPRTQHLSRVTARDVREPNGSTSRCPRNSSVPSVRLTHGERAGRRSALQLCTTVPSISCWRGLSPLRRGQRYKASRSGSKSSRPHGAATLGHVLLSPSCNDRRALGGQLTRVAADAPCSPLDAYHLGGMNAIKLVDRSRDALG